MVWAVWNMARGQEEKRRECSVNRLEVRDQISQQMVWGHVEIREDMNPHPIGAKVIIRNSRLKPKEPGAVLHG